MEKLIVNGMLNFEYINKHIYELDEYMLRRFIENGRFKSSLSKEEYYKGCILNSLLPEEWVWGHPHALGGLAWAMMQNAGFYGTVTWKLVNPLAEFLKGKRCLEVLAGRGWLSLALKSKGIDIIATDDFSWEMWNQVTDIERIDAVEAIKKYGKQVDYVIMSWPPMKEDTAFKVFNTLCEVNPKATLIYCGEDVHGNAADDDFFDAVEFEFIPGVTENYERWIGMHDDIYICRKRNS